MKKPGVIGFVFGLLATGTMVFAQTNDSTNLKSSPTTTTVARKKVATKKPAAKKPTVKTTAPSAKAKTPMKPVARTAVRPATGIAAKTMPVSKTVPAKNLYAQNTTTTPTTATDATTSAPAATSGQTSSSFTGLTLPGSGQVKTTAKVEEPSKPKSAFSFKYVSVDAENIDAFEAPSSISPSLDHEVQAWDRFYFGYALGENVTAVLMPQLFHTWFGNSARAQDPNNPSLTQNFAAYLGDTELMLKDSKIATIGSWTLDGVVGWYFPTSQASQQSSQLGQSDTGFGLGTSWGIVDFRWSEKLWYYFNGYTTSTLVDGSGAPLRNKEYAIWSLTDTTVNITKKFYFDFTAGFMNQALYADEDGARPEVLNDYIILDPEIGYTFSSNFALGAGFWEEYDMRNASQVGTNPNGTPIYVAQYTPLAAWNGGTQVYIVGTLKF